MIDYGDGLIFPDAWAYGPPDPPEPDEPDMVAGRYELLELVAVMGDDGRYRCPRCASETNSYGHHACTGEAS